jgi:hypothetical protein
MRSARRCAAAAAVALAACGNSTSPPDDFDPRTIEDIASGVFNVLGANPAVRSISAVADGFTGAFAGLAPARLQRAGVVADGVPIPDGARGQTFVFNVDAEHYELASGMAGAPANGSRFILYSVSADGESVALPPQEIGYLDLTDESSETPLLGVTAAVDGVTQLDYDVSATGSVFGGTLRVNADGYVTDGTARIDFQLAQSLSLATGFRFDYILTDPVDGTTATLLFTGDTQTALATSSLTVTSNGRLVTVQVTATIESAIEGVVTVDGATAFHIGGTLEDPTFTDHDGNPVTSAELAALNHLLDLVDDLFEALTDVLAPAYFVYDLTALFDL